MSELTNQNHQSVELMIKKLYTDPDKFERMFAAQYLAKYNLSKSKEHLMKAVLEDPNPEVVHCIRTLLKDYKITE
ncbi:MAG: HEAT repeat domain-containing protein [Candidatus Thorarchaeota archaeon]